MESCLYSVLDVKAQEYGPVFVARNDRLAERTVHETVRGGQSLLSRYPEDFLLYRVGRFEGSTGVILPEDRPMLICAVKDLLTRVEGGSHGAEGV